MKKYLICTVRSDGHADIQDHTNLLSEAERFEELGYEVIPSSRAKVTAEEEWMAA